MDKIIMSQMVDQERAFVTQEINLYDKLECLRALFIPFKVTPVSLEEFILIEKQIESKRFNSANLPDAKIIYDRENDNISIENYGIKYDITKKGKVINTGNVFRTYNFGENIMNIYTTEEYDDILKHYGFDKSRASKKRVKS